MTRPEPLYPRRRLTAVVLTLLLVTLTGIGQTIVILSQNHTIVGLKDTVKANDTHRHEDIKALQDSDTAQQKLLVNALQSALVEIRRLQRLVLRLGGNPGGFTEPTTAAAGGGGGTQPQPAASSPRPRPSGSSSPAPKPSPSHRPPPPKPSPTPTPCILPQPLPCVPK